MRFTFNFGERFFVVVDANGVWCNFRCYGPNEGSGGLHATPKEARAAATHWKGTSWKKLEAAGYSIQAATVTLLK